MFKNKPLKAQVQITFGLILLTSLIATIVTYVAAGILFLTLQSNELLYPADHYEKQLPAIENYIRQQNTALLGTSAKAGLEQVVPPEGIVYQVVDSDGRILYGTYRTRVIENREQLYGRLNTTSGYQGKYVRTVPIIGSDTRISGAVLLAYELKATSPDGRYRQWITGLFILAVAAPFFYIVLFTILFSRKLTRSISRPLQMLMAAARKIGEKDLDFTIDYHSKNEIGELCNAFTGMQEELKKSLSAQWKIEQERTEMVEALAHDLKTPLSIIRGYSEALADSRGSGDEKLCRYLAVIKENAEKSSVLVQQMQYTSDLEKSGAQLQLVPIKLSQFLAQKVRHYELQAKQKKIGIELGMQGDVRTPFLMDTGRLERILDNIVSNSLQYTPAEGRIRISVKAEKGCVSYTICDSGSGFRQKDLEKAFDKFYRGDEARISKDAHSGLGLYIVRQLAEQLGGSVRIGNAESGGACVMFWHKVFKKNEQPAGESLHRKG